jgi:hypothetical protein
MLQIRDICGAQILGEQVYDLPKFGLRNFQAVAVLVFLLACSRLKLYLCSIFLSRPNTKHIIIKSKFDEFNYVTVLFKNAYMKHCNKINFFTNLVFYVSDDFYSTNF